MKIKCLIHYLKEALSLAEKISGKSATLPILNSVLISVKKKELKITATNLEVGLEIKIPAKIEKEGENAVPAKLLYNFLSNFPSEENITLESSQNNLLISTNNNSTVIKGYPIEDFPSLPSIKEKEVFFELQVNDFILGLNSVYYASSLTEMKPEISSIFINSSKNTPLTFVATDSFRLARKSVLYNFSNFSPLLIPYRNTIEIMRVFENENGNIKIFPNKNQLFIFSERIKFVSRLTEGIFPDYEEIIPKTFLTEVIVDKMLFNNNLKTASIFSGKLNELKIEVIPDKKIMKLQTSHTDVGESTTNIPVEINGEKLKITFNHRYLIDGLRFVPSDKILLRFNGENKPLLVTGIKDNSFYYLVMPMKDI
jgi:DNA polymerase-3 subunit beta